MNRKALRWRDKRFTNSLISATKNNISWLHDLFPNRFSDLRLRARNFQTRRTTGQCPTNCRTTLHHRAKPDNEYFHVPETLKQNGYCCYKNRDAKGVFIWFLACSGSFHFLSNRVHVGNDGVYSFRHVARFFWVWRKRLPRQFQHRRYPSIPT